MSNLTTFEKLGWKQVGDDIVAGTTVVPQHIVEAVLGVMHQERGLAAACALGRDQGRDEANQTWFKKVMHERAQWRGLLILVAKALEELAGHEDLKEAVAKILRGELPAGIDDTYTAEVCDQLIEGIERANIRISDLQEQMAKIEAGTNGIGADDVYQLIHLLVVKADLRAARRLLTSWVRQNRLNGSVVERLLTENVLPSASVSPVAPNLADFKRQDQARAPGHPAKPTQIPELREEPTGTVFEEEILRHDQRVLCSFCLESASLKISLKKERRGEVITWGALCRDHRPRLRELRDRISQSTSSFVEARNIDDGPPSVA